MDLLKTEDVFVASDRRVPVVAPVRKHELSVPKVKRTHETAEGPPLASRVIVFVQLMRTESMGYWVKSPAALICSYIPTTIIVTGILYVSDPPKIVEEPIRKLITACIGPKTGDLWNFPSRQYPESCSISLSVSNFNFV
jgi:hypothetical protein